MKKIFLFFKNAIVFLSILIWNSITTSFSFIKKNIIEISISFQAFFTVVLAIATIVYVYATINLASATKEMVEINKKSVSTASELLKAQIKLAKETAEYIKETAEYTRDQAAAAFRYASVTEEMVKEMKLDREERIKPRIAILGHKDTRGGGNIWYSLIVKNFGVMPIEEFKYKIVQKPMKSDSGVFYNLNGEGGNRTILYGNWGDYTTRPKEVIVEYEYKYKTGGEIIRNKNKIKLDIKDFQETKKNYLIDIKHRFDQFNIDFGIYIKDINKSLENINKTLEKENR